MTKQELIKELERVPIARKTYEEYLEAVADKVIELFAKEETEEN